MKAYMKPATRPAPSGGHKGTQGSGTVTPRARGVMGGSGSHECKAKGVQGRGG